MAAMAQDGMTAMMQRTVQVASLEPNVSLAFFQQTTTEQDRALQAFIYPNQSSRSPALETVKDYRWVKRSVRQYLGADFLLHELLPYVPVKFDYTRRMISKSRTFLTGGDIRARGAFQWIKHQHSLSTADDVFAYGTRWPKFCLPQMADILSLNGVGSVSDEGVVSFLRTAFELRTDVYVLAFEHANRRSELKAFLLDDTIRTTVALAFVPERRLWVVIFLTKTQQQQGSTVHMRRSASVDPFEDEGIVGWMEWVRKVCKAAKWNTCEYPRLSVITECSERDPEQYKLDAAMTVIDYLDEPLAASTSALRHAIGEFLNNRLTAERTVPPEQDRLEAEVVRRGQRKRRNEVEQAVINDFEDDAASDDGIYIGEDAKSGESVDIEEAAERTRSITLRKLPRFARETTLRKMPSSTKAFTSKRIPRWTMPECGS